MRIDLSIFGSPLVFSLEGFHGIYVLIALFTWSVSALFSLRYFQGHSRMGHYWKSTLWILAALLLLLSSENLSAAFLFLVMISFISDNWVAFENTKEAHQAAGVYKAVACFGAGCALVGLIWLCSLAGTLNIDGLRAWSATLPSRWPLLGPGVLIFIGFSAKAGIFPLHIWLPKAHPVAPAPASALLSGMLTKAGLYGIIILSCHVFFRSVPWGAAMLVLGGINMLLGAVMGVFSANLKHTLACSSMSQIGFILIGVGLTTLLGEENALAARGAMFHMMNHSFLKLNLFLCAGAVALGAHSLSLTKVRGFGRKKPLLHICFLIGFLGLACVPPLNGYLSKSLLHEALLEYDVLADSWLVSLFEKVFLFCGGLTFAYMAKLYLCLFWLKNRDPDLQSVYDAQKTVLTTPAALALILSSLPPVILALFPNKISRPILEASMGFFRGAPLPGIIAWYSADNLRGAGVSLLIGNLVCFLVHRFLVRDGEYPEVWPAWLDLEKSVYRPVLTRMLPSRRKKQEGCK